MSCIGGALVICCRSLSYSLCGTFFRNILFSRCAILGGGALDVNLTIVVDSGCAWFIVLCLALGH